MSNQGCGTRSTRATPDYTKKVFCFVIMRRETERSNTTPNSDDNPQLQPQREPTVIILMPTSTSLALRSTKTSRAIEVRRREVFGRYPSCEAFGDVGLRPSARRQVRHLDFSQSSIDSSKPNCCSHTSFQEAGTTRTDEGNRCGVENHITRVTR